MTLNEKVIHRIIRKFWMIDPRSRLQLLKSMDIEKTITYNENGPKYEANILYSFAGKKIPKIIEGNKK